MHNGFSIPNFSHDLLLSVFNKSCSTSSEVIPVIFICMFLKVSDIKPVFLIFISVNMHSPNTSSLQYIKQILLDL